MSAEQPLEADVSSREAGGNTRPSASRRGSGGDGLAALGLAASVILVGAACRELLHFQPLTRMSVSLAGSVEDFFFEPSDSSPLAVLGLCGWLLWRRRARLAALWGCRGPAAITAGCWALAAALFAWAVRVGAPDLQAVALIPALLGAGNLLGGSAALRVMGLPAAVLVFAVPVPAATLNQVVWFLQIQTAEFTGFLLRLVGVEALVSGERIVTSGGLFVIIETCSGIRSIETLLLLTVLMVDLFERRGWHAVALFALAPAVAFLINGLRCIGLIFNPHADIASVHSLQGIAMLLGGVLLLYFSDGLLARLGRGGAGRRAARRRPRPPRDALGARAALVAGFSLVLLALSWLPRFEPAAAPLERPVDVIDTRLAGWESSDEKVDWLFLGGARFRSIANRRYAIAGAPVDLFVGQADPDTRLRSYLSPKVAFPGSGWIVQSERRVELAGRPVTERLLRQGGRRVLAVHWFEGSPGIVGESVRGLFGLDASPVSRSRYPVAVRLSTPVVGTRDTARRAARGRLRGFVKRIIPSLNDLVAPRGVEEREGKRFPILGGSAEAILSGISDGENEILTLSNGYSIERAGHVDCKIKRHLAHSFSYVPCVSRVSEPVARRRAGVEIRVAIGVHLRPDGKGIQTEMRRLSPGEPGAECRPERA